MVEFNVGSGPKCDSTWCLHKLFLLFIRDHYHLELCKCNFSYNRLDIVARCIDRLVQQSVLGILSVCMMLNHLLSIFIYHLAVVLGVVQFVGSIFGCYLVDLAGRKVRAGLSGLFSSPKQCYHEYKMNEYTCIFVSFISDFIHLLVDWCCVEFGPFGCLYDGASVGIRCGHIRLDSTGAAVRLHFHLFIGKRLCHIFNYLGDITEKYSGIVHSNLWVAGICADLCNINLSTKSGGRTGLSRLHVFIRELQFIGCTLCKTVCAWNERENLRTNNAVSTHE